MKKTRLASTLAMILYSGSHIYAQETPEQGADESELEVIQVKGLRGSLIKASDMKRMGDTLLDGISAEDIGALPDRSVLEAMQRIPGVSIERFAAANDPDHFGIEGSGAVIRGMTQTRSEFNGRDTFSANSSRGLSFQDVPPELMGSVLIYKNQSADMIEGGIGGTVNLNTRKPFDQDGRVIAFTVDATYADFAEKTSPTGSLLLSNTWNTDKGKFGLLTNIAYSKLTSRSDGLQSEIFLPREDIVDGQRIYAPNGGNMNTQIQERERKGFALAAQWESLDKKTVVTGQFLRSDATLAWAERTMSYQTNMYADDGTLRAESFPLDDFPTYDVDSNGEFQSGYLTNVSLGGWRSNGNDGERVPQAADWSGNPVRQFGNTWQNSSRIKDQQTIVDDFSVNIKYRPNDTWAHEFDIQRINATTDDKDFTIFLGTHANQYLDLSGEAPNIEFLEPWNGQAGGNGRESNPAFFQDKSSYYWRSAMDHLEDSDGDETALAYDTIYTFESGAFTFLKMGARYAKREQTVKFSVYNWQPLGAIFSGDPDGDGYSGAWLDLPYTQSLVNDVDQVSWDNHFRGGHVTIPGDGTTFHPSFDLVRDYANAGARLGAISSDWEPLADRPRQQLGLDSSGNPIFEEFDGSFRPNEVNTFSETNTAFYIRGDFEYDDWTFPISGNIGVRYVELERETQGYISFPNLEIKPREFFDNGSRTPEEIEEEYSQQVNLFIPDDDLAFGNYATRAISSITKDEYILPSFNLKIELQEDLLLRFAASKALAYPNTGDLKSFVTVNNQNAQVVRDGDGEDSQIVSADITAWTGNSANPNLQPMQSKQYDLALEWYFDQGSSLTSTIFYKDLKDFWVTGGVDEQFTNNGVTNTVTLQKPINTDKGKMKGVELAFQHFFGSLPEPFNHLGIQANYTYIEASGVPNSNLFTTDPDGQPKDGPTQLAFEELPLAGQSKHTANLVLMYENDKISARFAYNWRSEYLITARDVIAPHRPIYGEDAGYLDGSFYYNLTENLQVGLQGVNLLDTITKTSMQVDEDGTRFGRSWFKSDRRFSLVLRGNF